MNNAMIDAVEAYLAAKFVAEKAEAALKIAKDAAIKAVGGYGFLEGNTADLEIGIQAKKTINEQKLIDMGLTKAEIDACKVEGAAYPVIRIKAKKIAA